VSRPHRTRLVRAAALAAAAAVALAGCTSGGGGGGGGGGDSLYVEAISSEPQNFNPQTTNSPIVTRLGLALYDGLVEINTQSEIRPGLASDWESDEAGTQWTFTLEPDVTWHDGEPFTTDDVVFNFTEVMPFQTYGAAIAADLASVEAPDDSTVVVTLKEPYGPFLEALALQVMLPEHVYAGTDITTNPANLEPIGTGPMKFESYTSGSEVVLVKNEDYWDGEVQVDRAVFPVIGDTNARTLSLVSGEIDQAAIDASQLDQIGQNPDLVHLEGNYFDQAVVIEMNAQNEYLANEEVRRLVFSAIDRTAIADAALAGYAEPATGFVPDTLDWAVDDSIDFDELFPYDVEAVNEGLDAAGYPRGADGTRFTLRAKYIVDLTDAGATAEQARSMLADVGIDLQLESVTSAIFTDQVYVQSDFDLAFLRTTVSSDPGLGIARWYTCNPDKMAARNPSGICDDGIAAAAAAANATSDRAGRADAFAQLQQRAAELIFFAPLVWTDANFPTVSQARWDGLVELDPDTPNGGYNWTTMTWKG
jgi:peptide/nickel transport system substrate-binding protein